MESLPRWHAYVSYESGDNPTVAFDVDSDGEWLMRSAVLAALKAAPVSQGAGTVCPECASEDRCGIERGSTHVCHGAKPDEEAL